ncbi:TetR/AcrR family transcriptional regulator [Alteromonas lipolytica]|uniref:TetR family transcriptional regulator n=1 Tax=Alteromonas lipolytica TaxID=1856405 RepID=A0A1E8FC29_9ALTE|nr:TetR/AcrR family transcriptional regulator [Alteromonas lipolytica]OFI33470.1 TetR family transcriptional regulator [Alteromonas lipolytica]GGF59406.1 TetR family transcriptional regulator [Alteromonas lipolytica]
MATAPAKSQTAYHHGDLRKALLEAATLRIERDGLEGLSLRKLAEDIGVSRTALYHHFKDKSALLNAIAAQGFAAWTQMTLSHGDDEGLPVRERLRGFIFGYVDWARRHPQLYDLMFGSSIWKKGLADEHLKEVAYPAFQAMLGMISRWQRGGNINSNADPLRLTQVIWATVHGMVRLLMDGIYADATHLDAMCDCALELIIQA